MSKEHGYLVINLETGVLDGWYHSYELAISQCNYYRDEREGRWAVVRGVDMPEESGIGDLAWHESDL